MTTKRLLTVRDVIQRAVDSNGVTLDGIRAEFLIDCLAAFDKAAIARERLHGREFVSDAEKAKRFAGEQSPASY